MLTAPAPSRRRHRLRAGVAVVAATLVTSGLAACGSADTADNAASAADTDRVITTSTGDVTVPANPTRVVAGTAWAVNTLLDLGVTPVGAFNGADNVVLAKYRDAMRSVANISADDGYSDDLEKIAALKPDVAFTFASSESLDKEKQLVPTIGQDSANATWQELTAQVAEVIGKQDEFEKLAQEYADRLAALKNAYGDTIAATTWYVVQSGGDKGANATLYAPANTEAGVIISSLGGTFGPAEEGTTYGDDNSSGAPLSDERLSELGDADAIVVWDNGDEPSAQATALYAQPLWKRLPAVTGDAILRTSMPGSYGQALDFLDRLETLCARLQQKS